MLRPLLIWEKEVKQQSEWQQCSRSPRRSARCSAGFALFRRSRGPLWDRTLPTAVESIAVGRTSCWERAGPGWRRTKGLRCFQVSRAARDARGKRLFPHARAARGTSRSSTEQRPTEQSWSTGKRRRQQWDAGPGSWAAAELRMLEAGKEQRAGSLQPHKAETSSRSPSGVEPPPAEVQNAGSGRGVALHPAVTCCHISQASLETN